MAHIIYDNFVLENKVEEMVKTQIDMNNYLTPDYSLAESAGMVKKVNVYDATGAVEELAMGEGNTDANDIEVGFVQREYRVKTTQGRFPYYDEQEMSDPMVVEVGLQKIAALMVNDLTDKAIAEMSKAKIQKVVSAWNFDTFADAIALYPYENEEGLFCLINPAQKAAIRKALNNNLQYVEGFARTGYIGTVCNVPIIVSKAVPEGEAYLGTSKAITCFLKKGVEMEQTRDADKRKNTITARKVMLVALTDATRMIKLGAAQDTVATVASASGKAISGAASTGAVVEIYVNKELVGTATASNSAYSFTAPETLVSGDVVSVIARLSGHVDSTASKVVE